MPAPPDRRRRGQRSGKGGGRPPPVEGWASRLVAAQLVWNTLETTSSLDSNLRGNADYSALSPPDRGYARATASAALRALGRIDWSLGALTDRAADTIDRPVLALLRIGCAQLWLLDSPPYAVVSATVEAARRWPETRRAGGMVNAVLRRASRERQVFDAAPPTSVWPEWLAARLGSALGPAAARMAQLQIERPAIDLSFRNLELLNEAADRLDAERLPNDMLRLRASDSIPDLDGYASGDWWVQDAAASLAARLFGDVSGCSVIDLCAAPGGKAMQLAAAGAHLTAVDLEAERMDVLLRNFERTELPVVPVLADARIWRPDNPADHVLLDAPCSALGTLRRHPEGAWSRTPGDLGRYPEIQRALLASASEMVRPGGRVIYCVCTPVPEEGEDVVRNATAAGRLKRLPISPGEVPGFEHALTPDGDLLTLPPETVTHGTILSDTFYVSRLERT
ncbi:hypothetical protein GC169_10805 [bacterium]|nr:hypothetical protein [bacterium]